MNKRTLYAGLGLILLIAASVALRRGLDLEWTPESIRTFVKDAGIWAPLVFITLIAFRFVLLLPSQILLLAAGVLFGATLGTVYGGLGMTCSGLINYAVVRFAGVDAIRARFPKRFDTAFALAQSRMGAGAVVLATGYPVGPITGFQVGAAISGMGLFTYTISVFLGGLIRAGIYAYFGNAMLEGESLLLGAAILIAAFVIPFLIPRSRAWLIAALGVNDPVEPSGGVSP